MLKSRRRTALPPATGDCGGECACVVTCHNYARFLPECLDSLLSQTQPFEHVIVVDDASADDTPAVAARYAARGIRYLRTEFRDVALARNAGAEALPWTRFLLFVDADNRLAPNYRRALQAAMTDPGIGVAYCNLRYIGEYEGHLSPHIKPYDYWRLREANLADACSLIRREAWDQAGGFPGRRPEVEGGLQDWMLWLNITRAGWGMALVPGTELHYRLHPDRMSVARIGKYECGVSVMRDAMLTCIVTLFSGRRWALPITRRWLDRLQWNRGNLHLVALDNSRDASYSLALQKLLRESGIGYTYVRDDARVTEDASSAEVAATAELRMRHNVRMNIHLARLYALARQHLPARADLVWCVEDDVEPPPDALWQLCLERFRRPEAGMLAGCLRSRFQGSRLIAWESVTGEPHDRGYVTQPPPQGEVKRLSATGFFCTLFPRQVFEGIRFRPGAQGLSHPYYDWAAAVDVQRMGKAIYLVGGVRCGHWQDAKTCVQP
jgi:glycosyltransferase involved in cell wall biosynthesis